MDRGIHTPVLGLLAVFLTLPTGSLRADPGEAETKVASQADPGESSGKLEDRILLGAARNAVHRGDLKTAVDRFQRLLHVSPDQDQARLEYAGLLSQMGRVAEAKREYEHLFQKHPP